MDTSPRLSLPYILPSQAQKHVTVNESLRRLDALVQLTVQSTTQTTPPASPSEGDAYLLLAGGFTGAWSDAMKEQIAVYQDGIWSYIIARDGWACYDLETSRAFRFQGSEWAVEAFDGETTQLGINTTPDTINRLSVKSDAELLSHDDVTPGTGNARKVINKSAAGSTAAILFQSNWTSHAEIGLLGNNDLSVQVSPDGVSYQTCAQFDAMTGVATFPNGQKHAESNAFVRQTLPTPGGDGTVSVYRVNTSRGANPRSFSVASIAGDTITLSSPAASEILENTYMQGVSMIRIWNTSRSPILPAWVVASSGGSSIQVRDASELAGWLPGDTLQVGDPTGETPGRVIALDISPMMNALFGAAFYQAGIIAKVVALPGASAEAGLDISPDGAAGSFLGTRGYAGQASASSQIMIPSTVASPVSASNLLFVREQDLGGGIGIAIVSVNAVLV